MPANKRHQDREEKRAELLVEARRLFIEHGYENTSMASLAKAAGVAGNTIYWYFADKDDVLLAVLDDVLTEALGDYERVATAPLEDQVVWVVRQLQQMQRLVNTVHARAAHSPAIDEWHTGFHAIAEGMFREALAQAGVDHAGLDAEVKIGVFTVEGLLTHGLSQEEQQAICRRLAEQWTRPT
ncbi:TetR/AcrR family transcriptional regulator [Nocardioides sp. J54]|uniref:TetR/AcrR family transcriptional regulator n=1 Tax=Nocardioides sp. J54 TaxID=935866 RepID=UPI00048CC97C|nr:TetR/AcrR family transcriptional regulator [Nocardioides sp. J54]